MEGVLVPEYNVVVVILDSVEAGLLDHVLHGVVVLLLHVLEVDPVRSHLQDNRGKI